MWLKSYFVATLTFKSLTGSIKKLADVSENQSILSHYSHDNSRVHCFPAGLLVPFLYAIPVLQSSSQESKGNSAHSPTFCIL